MNREENGNRMYKGSVGIKTDANARLKYCLEDIRSGSEIWIVDKPIGIGYIEKAIKNGRKIGKEEAVERLLRRYQGRAERSRVDKMRDNFDFDVNMIKKHLDQCGLGED